jgi:hypothetical protein
MLFDGNRSRKGKGIYSARYINVLETTPTLKFPFHSPLAFTSQKRPQPIFELLPHLSAPSRLTLDKYVRVPTHRGRRIFTLLEDAYFIGHR